MRASSAGCARHRHLDGSANFLFTGTRLLGRSAIWPRMSRNAQYTLYVIIRSRQRMFQELRRFSLETSISNVRQMRYLAAFEGIPGILEAVVGDTDGRLIEAKGGFTPENEGVAALGAVLWRQVASLSSALQRGSCEMLVIRTAGSTGILLFRESCVAHLEIEPKRLSPDLETKLRVLDWVSPRSSPSAGSTVSAPPAKLPPPLPPARDSAALKARALREGPPSAPPAAVSQGKRSDTDGVPARPASGQTETAAPSVDAPKRRNTGAAPSAAPAVLAGDLAIISVPDLLEFCRNGQRTGTLTCRSDEQACTVILRRGMISAAVSPESNAASMLARLTDKGRLSQQQVRSALQGNAMNAEPSLVAQRLLEAGLLDAQTIRESLMEQVQDAINELLDWVNGRFDFLPTADESSAAETDVLADPQMILLRIFKERDEKDRDQADL